MRISDWSSDVCSSDLRMASRRIRDVQNSCHRNVPAIRKRMPFNYAYLNPEELIDLDLKAGDMIEITSDAGTIVAAVEPDPTLRRAVVSITHGWGGLPEDRKGGV